MTRELMRALLVFTALYLSSVGLQAALYTSLPMTSSLQAVFEALSTTLLLVFVCSTAAPLFASPCSTLARAKAQANTAKWLSDRYSASYGKAAKPRGARLHIGNGFQSFLSRCQIHGELGRRITRIAHVKISLKDQICLLTDRRRKVVPYGGSNALAVVCTSKASGQMDGRTITSRRRMMACRVCSQARAFSVSTGLACASPGASHVQALTFGLPRTF